MFCALLQVIPKHLASKHYIIDRQHHENGKLLAKNDGVQYIVGNLDLTPSGKEDFKF